MGPSACGRAKSAIRAARLSYECPHFSDWEYIRDWRAAHSASYVILVHSHLGVGWENTGIVRGSFGSEDDREDAGPRFEPSFNPADAAIVVCDEDPTASLIAHYRIARDAIAGITEHGLGEHILAGLATSAGLLDHLRRVGAAAEQLRLVAKKQRGKEGRGGQIVSPGASDAAVSDAVNSAASLARVSDILDRLADELESGRPGRAYSLLAEGERLIAQGRRPWPFLQRWLLILDGTANPEILRQFIPPLGQCRKFGCSGTRGLYRSAMERFTGGVW